MGGSEKNKNAKTASQLRLMGGVFLTQTVGQAHGRMVLLSGCDPAFVSNHTYHQQPTTDTRTNPRRPPYRHQRCHHQHSHHQHQHPHQQHHHHPHRPCQHHKHHYRLRTSRTPEYRSCCMTRGLVHPPGALAELGLMHFM